MGAGATQTGTRGACLHDRHQEPARGGAEGLDCGVARPGPELRQIGWNAEGRSNQRGRHCFGIPTRLATREDLLLRTSGWGPPANQSPRWRRYVRVGSFEQITGVSPPAKMIGY